MSTTCQGAGGGGPGVRYSFSELEGLWLNNGGPGGTPLAATMAAIALAESGGCTTALNPTDNHGTQTSWGLWQISTGNHASPGANWNTGNGNARLAVAKYHTQGLGAWGTYTSGAYKQFLNGNAPDTAVNGGASGGGSGTGQAAQLTGVESDDDCLIGFPTGKVLFLTVGGSCILTKSQARAVLGSAILANGALVTLAGLLVLAAYGLKSEAAGKAAGAIIGTGARAAGAAGASRASAGASRAAGRARAAGTGGATGMPARRVQYGSGPGSRSGRATT